MNKETTVFFEKATELKSRYFKEVVNPLLKNAEPISNYMTGGHQLQSIEMTPQLDNSYLKGSTYEYKNRKLKFIHFTKVDSAKSIIKSAIMRMYSLLSMNDPQELSYALLDIIPVKTEKTINEYKQNLFTLSMNEFQDEKEEINTWLDYGDCGKGAGIVLSFDKKEQNSWRQHYLSRIKYKGKDLNALMDFHLRHQEFANSTPVIIHGQVRNFLLPLATFHKTKDFEKEKEVRLLVINIDSFNNAIESQYEPVIVERKKSAVTKSYIEFLLNPPNREAYKPHRPVPKIEKIILGPRIENTVELIEEFKELARRGLGYEIEVEISKQSFNC